MGAKIQSLKFSQALVGVLGLICAQSGLAQTQGSSLSPLKTTSSGRKPASNLKLKSSKVPTFEIHKSKSIPRLDIGEEPTFEVQSVELKLPPSPVKAVERIQKKDSPKVFELDKKKWGWSPATAPKSLANTKTLAQIPEVKALKEIPEPTIKETTPDSKEMISFKPQEFKILEGQIYAEILKNHEMALAHFAELVNDKDFAMEGTYHYALSAGELNLPTEFRVGMLKVARQAKSSELQNLAVKALVQNIERLQISDVKDVEALVQKLDFDTSSYDSYQFYRAKYFLEKGELSNVEESLQLIGEKSKHRLESKLIAGLSAYRQGKISEAADLLTQLLEKSDREAPTHAVAAVTLARIQFQKGAYKEAFETYKRVDKSHPLWLQAMVEQAWTQILGKDFEGAAGNMFSLHTDFFKNAYNPESYVVRTVGYLNLCQFGDGMQVLNSLGRRYAPMVGRLENFSQKKKNASDYYDLVRTWLKNTEMREVEGIPRSFIVELARHPSFVTLQKQINNYEDEINSFNNVTLKLLQREKDLIRKQAEAQQELSKIHAKMNEPKAPMESLKADELFQQKRIASYKYQYQSANRARNSVKEIREKSFTRIDKEKLEIRGRAADSLKTRFASMSSDLKHILDQNEVLQYEIYSGAGEHIRFQASGGETAKRDPSAEDDKKLKDKRMKWSFQGEIWEDEIGHFRSSLKNVCPADETVSR